MPRYPIYIPSKGRADDCRTAEFLKKDKVPFFSTGEGIKNKQVAVTFHPELDQTSCYTKWG